ncbi:MAG: NAD(P)H-quinone oxidoreductase [Candidatus Lambdaproteobacteria bacterium]|nr:NAD(P)H-quinone oxidoreductase [Candidatus Lambdaproteobacteria bacterium]
MRAVAETTHGGPDVLRVSDVPIPKPGPQQVLVRVRASALNRADAHQREGNYALPPGESNIFGLEMAGEVESWGSEVKGFRKGQRVFGLVGSGGYAEYCPIDHEMAMPIPEGWSFEQAAAVPEVFFTAQETVFTRGELRKGETALIHAGGSGVGTAAIQMARHAGARVFFTAGSAEKIARGVALGAEAGINYKTQDFAVEVMKLTNGEGVDFIEDFVGAPYFARNIDLLKLDGRICFVARMGGSKVEFDISALMRKRAKLCGFQLRVQALPLKRAITRRFRQTWLPALASGKLHPVIDTVFPLEKAGEAHAYMEANRNFGKIVLRVD